MINAVNDSIRHLNTDFSLKQTKCARNFAFLSQKASVIKQK